MAIYKWLRAHWRWGAAVALAVVASTFGADFFAKCLGYAEVVAETVKGDDAAKAGLGICASHSAGLFRRDFLIALVAVIGIGAALWRAAAFDRQTRVAENRLLRERFAIAAELMAKENNDSKPAITARISGIHIIEKLATNAPKEFAEQVINNLIAYIKEHAQLTAVPLLEKGKTPDGPRMLGEDVKAAFAVLHNILSDERVKAEINGAALNAILDFSYQDFSWLNLSRSHVNLSHYKKWVAANLTSSHLFYANLKGANFLCANLKGAYLNHAILSEANLSRSKMAGANLWKSDLRGAKLEDADLSGSDLHRARLQGANLLRATFQDMWENEDRASLEFAWLDGARLEGVVLRDARMHGAYLRGVVILDSDSKNTDFRNAVLTKAHFGETCISCKEFSPAGLPEVKAAMGGKVWHSGAGWAQGVKQRPADAEWDLTQYEDGYALAGILENFAKENNSEFNSINLRQQARKLLGNGKLPEDTPQKWRKWLAEIDPATGLTSTELAWRGVLSSGIIGPPPEQEETPRTKQN
ncbi:MAG: pentapeptide repeat-containing protein [Gammaproteobacteria bacterium]